MRFHFILIVALAASLLVAFLLLERPGSQEPTTPPVDSPSGDEPSSSPNDPGAPIEERSRESRAHVRSDRILAVVDPSGAAIAGAVLEVEGELIERATADGHLRLEDGALESMSGSRAERFSISSPGFVTARFGLAQIYTLERAVLQRAWNLTLTVQGEHGEALSGALVSIFDEDLDPLVNGETDALGQAHMTRLETNPVYVSSQAPGYEANLTRFLAGFSGEEHLAVTLRRATSLEVLVSDPAGAPIEGALVSAAYEFDSPDARPRKWEERTNAGGVAVLEDFPMAGVYAVQAQAPGFAKKHRTVVMSTEMIEAGVVFVLAPFASLRVLVSDAHGTPRDARVMLDIWQRDDQARANGLVLKEAREGVRSGDMAGVYLFDEVPSGVSASVYAMIGEAAVGSVRDVQLAPREQRDVAIAVPVHYQLEVRVRGLDACAGALLRLAALDGRLQEPAGPPWVVGAGPLIAYEALLDESCRVAMEASLGMYRLTVSSAERQPIHSEDVEILGPLDLDVRIAPTKRLTGALRDASGSLLAGWTVVARATDGLAWSGSTRTTAKGFYAFDSPAARVSLHVLVPPTQLPALVAENLRLPAEGLALEVALCPLEARIRDFESGELATGTLRAQATGWPWWSQYQGSGAAAIPSGSGSVQISMPPGRFLLEASGATGESSCRAVVELAPGRGAAVEMYLTRRKTRHFDVSGLEPHDLIRWTALGPRIVEGEIFLMASGAVETNAPDGWVRFERVRNGEVFGSPINVHLGDDPVVLRW